MAEVLLNDAQKGVVRRYVDIWRRWRPGIRGFADLEKHMECRFNVLADGIAVDDTPGCPVIMADTKDDQFYNAIFHEDDDAVPDLTADELAQARRYVIRGEGTIPTRKWRQQLPRTAPVFTLHAATAAVR
jgi:tRNA A37 threonylcarbamoyladenosine modification protein TsaB